MKKHRAIEPYKVRGIAVFLTALIGLIVITPLCGLLFQCRCDWPWLDFYFECNFFDPEASYKCPWCNSNLAGFGSIGAAFLFSTLASLFITPKANVMTSTVITARLTIGLTVFILVAAILGMLASNSQHYPLGIGGLNPKVEEEHLV